MPRWGMHAFVRACPFVLGQPDELREWRRWLATRAAQLRGRGRGACRLRVPLKLTQIELLQLPAAGHHTSRKRIFGRKGDADRR